MTSTEKAKLDDFYRGFQDHPAWAKACLTIKDKAGMQAPLELWPAQLKLNALIEALRKQGKPVRIVVLKARRVSMSVAVSAEFFHQAPFRAGQHAMVLAHQLDAAAEIFDYYQQFQDSYRPYGGVVALPPLKAGSAGRSLRWINGSWVRVATANNLKTGRASSVRYLNMSEFAFYRDARTLMLSLMQCVPDDRETMVIIDSTANGVGGRFHELWQEASDPLAKSVWTPLFFAWWEHPEYRLALDIAADAFERSLAKSERYGDEPAERAKYNLTLEQLHWRRWAIDAKCGRSVRAFRQEYPGSPEEAFLTSGTPRFCHDSLGRMAVQRDPMRGSIETTVIGTREEMVFIPLADGPLAVYRKPERGRTYVLGADPASGKDVNDGKGNEDRDFCVATVIDADSGEQVATWRGRMEPAPFGRVICALGRYFNWAYCVPEANTWGIGVLEEMLRQQYPVTLIYSRDRSPSDRQSASVHKIGFETTSVTREQLISALDMAIREFAVLIRDAQTLAECLTFVRDARGRAEGQQGCHDDEVFALGLAVMGLRTAPRAARTAAAGQAAPVARYGGRRLSSRRGSLE